MCMFQLRWSNTFWFVPPQLKILFKYIIDIFSNLIMVADKMVKFLFQEFFWKVTTGKQQQQIQQGVLN